VLPTRFTCQQLSVKSFCYSEVAKTIPFSYAFDFMVFFLCYLNIFSDSAFLPVHFHTDLFMHTRHYDVFVILNALLLAFADDYIFHYLFVTFPPKRLSVSDDISWHSPPRYPWYLAGLFTFFTTKDNWHNLCS
jgi:hypothetical protein